MAKTPAARTPTRAATAASRPSNNPPAKPASAPPPRVAPPPKLPAQVLQGSQYVGMGGYGGSVLADYRTWGTGRPIGPPPHDDYIAPKPPPAPGTPQPDIFGIDIAGIDVSALLGIAGLPADVAREVAAIFGRTSDLNTAIQLALAYVRGTSWYAETYPGIQYGFAKGLFSDERGYRAYTNDLNLVYQQYFNRAVASNEVVAALQEGIGTDIVARRFQGDVIAKTNAPDWNYAFSNFGDPGSRPLSAAELQATGRQAAGLPTPLGANLQAALTRAMNRLQGVFGGTLGAPSLALQTQGVTAPSLLGSRGTPDIGA